MRRFYKYRLYPNRSQAQVLDAMLESHRRLYNLALRERRDVYEVEKRSVSYGEQSGRFKETRKVVPSFTALNFSSAQATLRRLDKAFRSFFRRVNRDSYYSGRAKPFAQGLVFANKDAAEDVAASEAINLSEATHWHSAYVFEGYSEL